MPFFSILCAKSLHAHELQRRGFFYLRNIMLSRQVFSTR